MRPTANTPSGAPAAASSGRARVRRQQRNIRRRDQQLSAIFEGMHRPGTSTSTSTSTTTSTTTGMRTTTTTTTTTTSAAFPLDEAAIARGLADLQSAVTAHANACANASAGACANGGAGARGSARTKAKTKACTHRTATNADAGCSQTAAALANMLDENKEEKVLKEACVRLCQLFGEGIQNDRIQAILEANVVPKLVSLLRPSRARAVPISVQAAALQVLGNVACGDDRQTQVVIDSDALPCLRALLASADRGIRKEVCWIVSNITESSHQVQDVLDADILPPLLKLLDSQDAACREDATWVLFNLSSNREPRQISYLADKNGVRALCNLLTCAKDLDVLWKGCGTVAAVALKGLRNILICGQSDANTHPLGYNRMAALVADAHGVERIEALTQHASHDVRLRARLLLERMFGAEPSTVDLQPPRNCNTATTASSQSANDAVALTQVHNCECDDDEHQQHHHAYPHTHYPPPTFEPHPHHPTPSAPSSLSTVEHNASPGRTTPHSATNSTSPSSTDSDPEDEDSDSDLIPPPPLPCECSLCTDRSPLPERRPRAKIIDDPDLSDAQHRMRHICDFCNGSGRLGDGRAGMAAKLGRAVRLGHSHCLAVLLSRMNWSQRLAATDAPALLHPGGGPPASGYGSNMPAIALAAQLGKPRCLELLLARCKPDLKQTYGKKRYTLLAWAALKGYVRCTQLLMDYGADPATKCADGYTALHLAAASPGNTTICKLLLGEKPQQQYSHANVSAMHAAPPPLPQPRNRHALPTKDYVNAITEKKQTPLCLAAQKGNWKIAQLLLAHGANPNNEDAEKYTPVHLAASNGYVDCLNLLLKADAAVDCKTLRGITPLAYAVQGGHASCVRLLINAGAKVNCAKKPLLLIAADEGKPEVVQILLDALATIDCKAYIKAYLDKENEISDHLTPLHLAASKGNNEVVELLLRRGANVDSATDNSKWTALDFAVLNGHSQCAICLLKHGATVSENCKNIGRNNWTLVQYAAQQGAKEVVRLLVSRLKDQRMKAKGAANNKFEPNPTTEFSNTSAVTAPSASEKGAAYAPNAKETDHMVAPLAPAPDNLPFPAPGSTNTSVNKVSKVNTTSQQAKVSHTTNSTLQTPSNHIATQAVPPPVATNSAANTNAIAPATRNLPVDSTHPSFPPPQSANAVNSSMGNSSDDYRALTPLVETPPEPPATTTSSSSSNTRRRAPKEDREAIRRQRDIKKREDEAAEARIRLDEAISQRSIAKLTEAISHVSKLVLHLATSTTNDALNNNPPAPHATHSADYGAAHMHGAHPHPDDYTATAHMTFESTHPPSTPNGSATAPPITGFTSPGGTPLPVEVGLGNEVMKARKMLAELQGEERRQRDERAREAADNKRDTAQQSVMKAMSSTLQGGDSRILVRTVNRALRTILDSDDPVILEAKKVSSKIEALEKAEEEMSAGRDERNLEKLQRVVPLVEEGLKEVRNIGGTGAAERIFGPSGPETAIQAAKVLCEELAQERREQEEQRAKAQNRERMAKDMLQAAMKSQDMKRMETAIEDAAKAVLSKESELSSAIDAAKKQFAKILKGERRKLRQANATSDPDTIDAAVEAAAKKQLKSLESDIKTARDIAQRLRDQKQAKIDLEDAVADADVTRLTELRTRLKDLGMFEEEERARAELDTLQRAARARSLLEAAIADAKDNIDMYRKKKGKDKEWKWPDTQRLHDLAERSRKYGNSMAKLCDSAVDLLKNLALTGREVLRTSITSDDATVIAASISGYEKSFMAPSCSGVFGKEAGNRILADARKKLAQVQAADQAKVRAEARQVKQSFAMASSRRHNVKNRTTRKERKDKEKEKEKEAVPNGNALRNVSVDTAIASNNSSEYGGDDEASDADPTGTAAAPQPAVNARKPGARRPRANPLQQHEPVRPQPVQQQQSLHPHLGRLPPHSRAPVMVGRHPMRAIPTATARGMAQSVQQLPQQLNHQQLPQQRPPQGLPPQRLPPQAMPTQGLPPQGLPPQGLASQGLPPQALSSQGLTSQGLPSQGLPPQGLSSQGLPSQVLSSQGLSTQGLPPQGLPSQGLPPQGHSPPRSGLVHRPVHFAPARAQPAVVPNLPIPLTHQRAAPPPHPSGLFARQPYPPPLYGVRHQAPAQAHRYAPQPPAPPHNAPYDDDADLGVEFASQNFGFDIDAIVDDNPPPPPPIHHAHHVFGTRGKHAQYF